jgi:hypothetical protein
MFENKALRKICAPMREVVRADRRILHNEELHDLYSNNE